MKLFVSHISAIRYWRAISQIGGISETQSVRIRSLSNAAATAKEVKEAEPDRHGLIMDSAFPLHILVPSASKRITTARIKPHVWPYAIPYSAFRQIPRTDIYVASPELAFLQVAASLDLVEASRLGLELCGYYSLGPHDGFYEREPVTTPEQLKGFVSRSNDVRGAQKVSRALKYITDGSASPQETNLLLALCLPSRLGGYALPMPEMNPVCDVDARLSKYVDGDAYCPDLLWIKKVGDGRIRVTAEYDSHDYHDEYEDAEKTRIRRNEFKTLGYLVTSVNRSQMRSARSFEFAARQIARDLRLYRAPADDDEIKIKQELLNKLANEKVR